MTITAPIITPKARQWILKAPRKAHKELCEEEAGTVLLMDGTARGENLTLKIIGE